MRPETELFLRKLPAKAANAFWGIVLAFAFLCIVVLPLVELAIHWDQLVACGVNHLYDTDDPLAFAVLLAPFPAIAGNAFAAFGANRLYRALSSWNRRRIEELASRLAAARSGAPAESSGDVEERSET